MGNCGSLLMVSCVFLTACAGVDEGYPPPLQRPSADVAYAELRFVRMNDTNADDYIVRGVQDKAQGTGWRWTYERPELRFNLARTAGQRFSMDFSFPEQTFKDTGPVTVSFLINGQLLDKVRYTTPGDKHFEKAVPAEWLVAGAETRVTAMVDPPWVAPTDKARLGMVLYCAGFLE